MVQVHIYYETLDTEITEEKPAYDLNDFGCKYCHLGSSYTKRQVTPERHSSLWPGPVKIIHPRVVNVLVDI